jgi:hypothetical protein
MEEKRGGGEATKGLWERSQKGKKRKEGKSKRKERRKSIRHGEWKN